MTYAMLWRAICFGCVLTASVSAFSQTFETLAYFSDGSTLFSSLIQGRDGDLYGTSNNGGTNGHGSVFKMTPSGELTTLYSFCSQPNCTDGFFPFSALVLGSDGNFYGTTQNGGSAGFGAGRFSKSRRQARSLHFTTSVSRME